MSGIRAAREAGLKVLVLDGNANAEGIQFADLGISVNISDADTVLQAVIASGIKPSGAVSFVNEAGMLAAGIIRDHFGLPGASRSVSEKLTDKISQRKAWDKAGLPNPSWVAVERTEDLQTLKSRLSGKIIVKPTDSAGSRGLSVINNDGDLKTALNRALSFSQKKGAIVETFIEGIEFTVESFGSQRQGHQVLAVTEKTKVEGTRGTVAESLATPLLPDSIVAEIGDLAVKALNALGYREGPGHTEIIRQADGKLFLVESAGRGGGFMVHDGIVPRASQYDIATATALQSIGKEALPVNFENRQAIVLRFLPTRPGRVAGFKGFDEVAEMNNVEAGPLVAIGQKVSQASSDADRYCYILSWHSDPGIAREISEQAVKKISIEMEPVL
jgi:biotin carboxylase